MLETLLAVGGKLAGGLLAQRGNDKANKIAQENAAQNVALQREFAQNAIQWKVADAAKAGIHPLYALGAQTTSFSPVQVGAVGGSPLGESLASMGQDLSRAVHQSRSKSGREAAIASSVTQLGLERSQLENELLRTQIAETRSRISGPQVSPAPAAPGQEFMIPGAGDTPLVRPQALPVTHAAPQQPSSEGGAVADLGYARTKTGWAPVPSADVKQRIEDQIIPELMWAFRNNVLPSFGMNMAPPPFPAPAGQQWTFNPIKQEYQLWDRAGVERSLSKFR